MASPFPRRSGQINTPAPAVAADRTPIFRDTGWLTQLPDINPNPYGGGVRAYKVPERTATIWTEPQHTFWRMQPQPTKVPQQYGSDAFSLGHYAPFHAGQPVAAGPLTERANSGYQPWSRGGHVLVSQTESNAIGGPGAAARMFANTRLGLWFKAWVVGGSNIRPLGSMQTPSPQFRGVLPNYGYNTLPQIIGG